MILQLAEFTAIIRHAGMLISTVGVAEVNLCFYCTALTRIHSIHTVRAEGSLVRSDSGLELVQALLPAGRLQAADRRLI